MSKKKKKEKFSVMRILGEKTEKEIILLVKCVRDIPEIKDSIFSPKVIPFNMQQDSKSPGQFKILCRTDFGGNDFTVHLRVIGDLIILKSLGGRRELTLLGCHFEDKKVSYEIYYGVELNPDVLEAKNPEKIVLPKHPNHARILEADGIVVTRELKEDYILQKTYKIIDI